MRTLKWTQRIKLSVKYRASWQRWINNIKETEQDFKPLAMNNVRIEKKSYPRDSLSTSKVAKTSLGIQRKDNDGAEGRCSLCRIMERGKRTRLRCLYQYCARYNEIKGAVMLMSELWRVHSRIMSLLRIARNSNKNEQRGRNGRNNC